MSRSFEATKIGINREQRHKLDGIEGKMKVVEPLNHDYNLVMGKTLLLSGKATVVETVVQLTCDT